MPSLRAQERKASCDARGGGYGTCRVSGGRSETPSNHTPFNECSALGEVAWRRSLGRLRTAIVQRAA